MSTFNELVDEVLSHLRGFTRDQEQSTHLTDDITASDTTLPVDDASILSRGRVEIGDELIWINRVNREAATADVPPYGRGLDSTTAAVHTVGSRIVSNPAFPRSVVKKRINQTIQSVGASLFGVKEEVLTPGYEYIYELPADVETILSVQVTDATDYGDSFYLRKWKLDNRAPSTISTTGKALYVYDGSFRTPEQIIVSYSCNPQVFTAGTQEFAAQTLLPATAEDVIVYLTAAALLPLADAAATRSRAVEANALDSKVQPGEASRQSKYLLALGQQRLQEENLRLLNSVANRSHYAW